MSLTQIPQRITRINRSELAVPGSNPRFIDAASRGVADVVFLDLEDAVAPSEKEQARKHVVEALQDIDWSGRTVSVRVNGLDTPYMYRDVVDVVEQHLDALLQRLLTAPHVDLGRQRGLLGSEARIDISNLRRGMLERQDFMKLAQAAGKLSSASLFIDETPAISVAELRTKCRRLSVEHDIVFQCLEG